MIYKFSIHHQWMFTTTYQSIDVFPFTVPILFPDENLPTEVTVEAGHSAEFHCQAGTDSDAISSTVAFFVKQPESQDLMQCLNCSFSPTELSLCEETVNYGSCFGLKFSNTSFSNPNLLTHNLTAHWSEVDTSHTGYEVVCAIAVDGITQWVNTATLTVLSATATPTTPSIKPTVTLTSDDIDSKNEGTQNQLSNGLIVGVTVGAVVGVGVALTVLILGLVLYHRQRHQKKRRILDSEQLEDSEKLPTEKYS